MNVWQKGILSQLCVFLRMHSECSHGYDLYSGKTLTKMRFDFFLEGPEKLIRKGTL